MIVGPKLRDGLKAFVEFQRERDDVRCYFVDARLEDMGYPPKVADSIIQRLGRKDWIEWGVSDRTGWLTPRGLDAARENGVLA